jgi:hypothetical protein
MGHKSRTRANSKPQGLHESWPMYPALHDSVRPLLEEHDLSFTFFATETDKGSIEEYDTNIMGRFKCLYEACPKKGWGSKMIAITVRMYCTPNNNTMPECITNVAKVLEVLASHSQMIHTHREAYRLKKWSGIKMDRPSVTAGTSERPHESALCEGCKHGHCKEVA